MEFLKEILGEELFNQLAEKINAHNGNEANQNNQIKLGNLGTGEYVSKAKHDALQALLDGKTTEENLAEYMQEDLAKDALVGGVNGFTGKLGNAAGESLFKFSCLSRLAQTFA